MKPHTLAITIAVLALPIYAQDQPRTNTTPTTTLSVPISVEQTDSPLVRAAKSTGRLGKKPGFVITNDTLLRVGASHMSIATSQGAPIPPAPKTPTVVPQQQRTPTTAKPKVDAANHRSPQQVAGDFYGDGTAEPRNDDPAAQEHQMQQTATPKPPQF